MNYKTEVFVKKLSVDTWLNDYSFPEKFKDLCNSCPNYGAVWSCPPNTPKAKGYLDCYKDVYVIGIKVLYSEDDRENADTPLKEEIVRKKTYVKVKKILLETLLHLEKQLPESIVLAAGRCEQCERCARVDNKPCVKPEKMRYSFTAFGFDFTKLAKELFNVELLWSGKGLPEYNVAIAALLTNKK